MISRNVLQLWLMIAVCFFLGSLCPRIQAWQQESLLARYEDALTRYEMAAHTLEGHWEAWGQVLVEQQQVHQLTGVYGDLPIASQLLFDGNDAHRKAEQIGLSAERRLHGYQGPAFWVRGVQQRIALIRGEAEEGDTPDMLHPDFGDFDEADTQLDTIERHLEVVDEYLPEIENHVSHASGLFLEAAEALLNSTDEE